MFEGQAEEAMRFYTSVFDDGEIVSLTLHDDAGPGTPGTVARAVFSLGGREFMAFDSPVEHGFTFTPAMSLFVDCDPRTRSTRSRARSARAGRR